MQLTPANAGFEGVANSNAAISALAPFISPRALKAVDPIITASLSSGRVIAANESTTVSVQLNLPGATYGLYTNESVGVRFDLRGLGSDEVYTVPLPIFKQPATLDLQISTPGTYRLSISIVYTPGSTKDPFNQTNFDSADGILPVTIPIVVTK